jgi:hypothetical protein
MYIVGAWLPEAKRHYLRFSTGMALAGVQTDSITQIIMDGLLHQYCRLPLKVVSRTIATTIVIYTFILDHHCREVSFTLHDDLG